MTCDGSSHRYPRLRASRSFADTLRLTQRIVGGVALLVLLGDTAAVTTARSPVPLTVRILTYNIHHGEGTDGRFDLPRLAGVIETAAPDLVALQEVDQGTARSEGVQQLTELGRLTGLHSAFGRSIEFQGGDYGVGVLSRWPILKEENHPLPGSPDREARTTLTVEVKAARSQPRIRFTSTHLDQGREVQNRTAQAVMLNQRLAVREAPQVLAGDFNSRPDSEILETLKARWTVVSPTDQLISPSGRPAFRVDYVLVRPADRWRVIDARVLDVPVVSDHRPVLVVLELTDGEHR